MKFIQNNKIRFAYPQVKLDADVGIFLYDPSIGKDYVLNRFGTLVWELLQSEKTIEDLLYILDQYKINENIILKNDVHRICKFLLKYQLISAIE